MGPELFDRARQLGRSIAFEASVAGGIPDHHQRQPMPFGKPDLFAEGDFERNQ